MKVGGTILVSGHDVCAVLVCGLSPTQTESLLRTWVQHSGWGIWLSPATLTALSRQALDCGTALPGPFLPSSASSMKSSLVVLVHHPPKRLQNSVCWIDGGGGLQVLRKLCMFVHDTHSLTKCCVSAAQCSPLTNTAGLRRIVSQLVVGQ